MKVTIIRHFTDISLDSKGINWDAYSFTLYVFILKVTFCNNRTWTEYVHNLPSIVHVLHTWRNSSRKETSPIRFKA